jgi:hypothetical protein
VHSDFPNALYYVTSRPVNASTACGKITGEFQCQVANFHIYCQCQGEGGGGGGGGGGGVGGGGGTEEEEE